MYIRYVKGSYFTNDSLKLCQLIRIIMWVCVETADNSARVLIRAWSDWSNICYNVDKYMLQIRQINLAIVCKVVRKILRPSACCSQATAYHMFMVRSKCIFFVRGRKRRANWAAAASHFHVTLQTLLTSLKHYKY